MPVIWIVVARSIALSVLLITTFVAPTAADAQATNLGPTPYTSAADSPFETTIFGFCIEDFENGKFDVPGATGNGLPISPGGITDSVDGDDGTIDGSGTSGRSYFTGDGAGGISINFDVDRTHGLPTDVGIVWTDGGLNAGVTFEAFGPNGVTLAGPNGPNAHADASNGGETAEDRFYGATNAAGISGLVISNPGGGIEVDHIQLNRCILCGDTDLDLEVTSSDALFALIAAIGIESCDLCFCDTNDSGGVTSTDALAILSTAVGTGPEMNCPPCNLD
jgi:hypothetical protein